MVTTRSQSKETPTEFLFLKPKKRYRPMIAASYTRNHIYGFKENDIKNIMNTYYYHRGTQSNQNKKLITINSFRKKRGLEFEKEIFNIWEQNSNIIMKNYDDMKWTYENCKISEEDIKNMKYHILKHIPIINVYNRVGGIPDILIRSDKIRDILNVDYPFLYESIHYVLLEIKYSSSISNYHRNQLYCYNNALKHIQNYEPKCAFVLNKTKSVELLVFTREDKKRYEESTRWYRKIKEIKSTIDPKTKLCKTNLYKKLKYVPRIRIPKIILNSKNLLDTNKRYIYYIFILDIDVSAFFITKQDTVIWHVSIVRVDTYLPEKKPIFISYSGNSFSSIETYKSVHFIYHNLVPNSDIIICSKPNQKWDWIDREWKNGYLQLYSILKNNLNIMSIDQLNINAWNYINSKNIEILYEIENNSKKYLDIAIKNIK